MKPQFPLRCVHLLLLNAVLKLHSNFKVATVQIKGQISLVDEG